MVYPQTPSRRLGRLWLLCCLFSASLGTAAVVRVESRDEGWVLTRDGQPVEVKGVGGNTNLALAKRLGATTIRTWGVDQLEPKNGARPLLDTVAAHGLNALVGLWIGHERHGFDYGDPAQVERQRAEVRAAVRRYRDHPALLVWGLGNEMEARPGSEASARIFRELEVLAQIIKAEDPDHPICTVVAVGEAEEIAQLRELAPSIDILGVNAYGSAPAVAASVAAAGWTRPFMLTEFGPLGHWEVAKSPWGAPIEPSSEAKAERYLSTHQRVTTEGAGRCLGTFAFVWGQKQETTGTWYGMFLRSGEKLPSVDAMAYAWTGHWPENRSPRIHALDSSARLARVAPGARLKATAEISDPENDAITAEWFVLEESTDIKEGGDREAEPPHVEGCVLSSADGTVDFQAPKKTGAYRLFVVVRDGRGGASADNFPFFVEHPAPTP